MKLFLSTVLALAILSGCATGPTYMGHPVHQAAFKVDAGKTISLPVTRAGALPAENEHYKIEFAGFSASVKKGNPAESELVWGFGLSVKNAIELASVMIEVVTTNGELKKVVEDRTPTLNGKGWTGRMPPLPMTRDAVPWLYKKGNSTFVFKFTIQAKDGSSAVLYQPSVISSGAKSMYLQLIAGR